MLSVVLGQDPFVFYAGSTSSNVAVPFTVRLDGRTYPVDLRNYRRSSLATLRDSIVGTGQVDDSLFNTDGAWWRYRRNWESGSGQSIMDLGESRDSGRFNTSVGIDVWDEGELKLLPATSLVNSDVDGSNIKLEITETYLYAMDDTAIYRTSDLSTWDLITITGTPVDIASDGVNLFVATSTKMEQVIPSSTTANHFANKVLDRIWFAAGYLFGSDGTHLHTYSNTGSETTIYNHFLANYQWTTVFAVGSKIYAGGYGGVKSELYGFTIDSGGALVLGAEVAPFGVNELILNAISHVGLVVICTNKGFRLATTGTDGSISYGPLIDDAGPVSTAFAQGEYCWFNWSGIAANKSGVGRLSFAITPGTLQPAFATDVYADVSATCSSVVRFNDRTVFALEGQGVYASSTTAYVESGSLTSGSVYYGTVELKSTVGATAYFDALASGERVGLIVTQDNGNEINHSYTQTVGQTGIEVNLNGEQANSFVVTVELSGSGTSTPTFRYWRLRAFPVVPPVEQYVVPLMLFSKHVVNDGQGQAASMDTFEAMETLIEAWRDKRPMTYVEGEMSSRVRLEAYEYQPHDWSDGHNGFEGVLTVRLVTL